MMTLNHMGLDLNVCELYSSKLGYMEIELYFFLIFFINLSNNIAVTHL